MAEDNKAEISFSIAQGMLSGNQFLLSLEADCYSGACSQSRFY